jgi:hypothetical protein
MEEIIHYPIREREREREREEKQKEFNPLNLLPNRLKTENPKRVVATKVCSSLARSQGAWWEVPHGQNQSHEGDTVTVSLN